MDDSITHPSARAGAFELPAWKTVASVISALLLALIMIVAGVWKITEPLSAAARMHQALVPASLSLPAAIGFGVAETFAGVLLLVPRFRRWGAWLSALLLVAFLIYMGVQYDRLRGEECNCFPWVQRAVGPAFFIGDIVMLLMAFVAGWWAKPSYSRKSAALVLAAVCVFAGVSYGASVVRNLGLEAPESILVEGQPYSLQQGRIILYFFDPECTHCLFAAREMAGYQWRDVRIVVIPTEREFLTQQFLEASGLRAPVSDDVAKLREVFKFGDPPFAVALEHGRQVAALAVFEGDQPSATLRRLGFIE